MSAPYIAAALALSLAALVSGAARAHSIECTNAQIPAQHAICNSEELLVMDEKLSAMVAQRFSRARTLAQRQELSLAQSQWLVERDRCGANWKCLEARYRDRITGLADIGLLAEIARMDTRQP